MCSDFLRSGGASAEVSQKSPDQPQSQKEQKDPAQDNQEESHEAILSLRLLQNKSSEGRYGGVVTECSHEVHLSAARRIQLQRGSNPERAVVVIVVDVS